MNKIDTEQTTIISKQRRPIVITVGIISALIAGIGIGISLNIENIKIDIEPKTIQTQHASTDPPLGLAHNGRVSLDRLNSSKLLRNDLDLSSFTAALAKNASNLGRRLSTDQAGGLVSGYDTFLPPYTSPTQDCLIDPPRLAS